MKDNQMADQKVELPAPPAEILLALLETSSRKLTQFFDNPQQNIPVEMIRTHIGRMFSFADQLVAIAEEHRAKAAADAEKNGEAPADQVN
jgi:hypothetical protein